MPVWIISIFKGTGEFEFWLENKMLNPKKCLKLILTIKLLNMSQQLLYKTCPDILESTNLWITDYRSPELSWKIMFVGHPCFFDKTQTSIYFPLFLRSSLILGLSLSFLTKIQSFLVFITKEQVENSFNVSVAFGLTLIAQLVAPPIQTDTARKLEPFPHGPLC